MFKVETFVEDKKLGELLQVLAGLVRGQPSVVPVINTSEDSASGGVKATTSGNLVHLLSSHLRHIHKTQITAKEIGAWLQSQGRSPMSASYIAREAVKAKILKKIGGMTSGHYSVVTPTKAAKSKSKTKSKAKPKATPKAEASA
jgi:hypothetical protein